MIPPPFEYVRPTSIDEAVAALTQHGDEAKVLAGGHSLLPLMKLRLAFPTVLVDVGRVQQLRGIREDDSDLVIGAATTHDQVLHDPLVLQHCGVLAEVTATVSDPQVRHRGTIGGALAHGDAAGDLPAAALALQATFVLQGPSGRRSVAASEFFRDYLETALDPTEVLAEIWFPKLGPAWSWRYEKFTRASHMWAIVGVCALVRRDGDRIGAARIGLTNMGAVPVRASAVEAALSGESVDAIPAAALAADVGTDPPADVNAHSDYRRHLARVLTQRALQKATTSWS